MDENLSPVSAIEAIEKAMEGVTRPDAPEWIAVAQDGDGPNGGFWTCAAATTESPRYIRADIYAALARQAEALQHEVDSLKQTRQHSREASAALHDAFMEERKRVEALQRENAEKDAEVARLRDALQFYATPSIYLPHPLGPAFDRRTSLYHAAKDALSGARALLGGENAE